MEPSLKWAANPNITVAVKAFGLKATVQVSCLVQSRFSSLHICVLDRAPTVYSVAGC